MFARIRACLDSCPHCGTLVCRADFGSIRNRTCTHHGWSYDLADALVSVPKRSDHPESFDTTRLGSGRGAVRRITRPIDLRHPESGAGAAAGAARGRGLVQGRDVRPR
ncbi:Rieske 2Fe-2S domain-containing protein [Streptomyces sp. NPDC051217]|uniref:Rieske 2Fe-2S domain-containing protein n=1 Tax=Streptomyces sp. NPDC051217 TaxID=3365644 RepID=UPI0037BB1DD1